MSLSSFCAEKKKKKRIYKFTSCKCKAMVLQMEKLLQNLKKSKRDFHQWLQLKGIEMRHMKMLGVKKNIDTYMEIVKKPINGQRGRRMRKRNHGKLRGWKYKPGKWSKYNSQSYVKRDSESQGLRRMKGCRRGNRCCMVRDMLLLWEMVVKTKKLPMGNKGDNCKNLDVLLLSRIKGANKKKKTFWIYRKTQGFRHKHRGSKGKGKWITDGLQLLRVEEFLWYC